MCCHLDIPRLTVVNPSIHLNKKGDYHVHITIQRSSSKLIDTFLNYFYYQEIVEKSIEIGDEIFHLFASIFKKNLTAPVYTAIQDLHQSCHKIEHFLHSFCFFGDLFRLKTGGFFVYRNESINFAQTTARILHFAAHFFSTLNLIAEWQICQLTFASRIVTYSSMLNTLGYGLWTLSLISNISNYSKNKDFFLDLQIHFGGLLSEICFLAKEFKLVTDGFDFISKCRGIATIIHSQAFIHKLMPPAQEDIHFSVSKEAYQ